MNDKIAKTYKSADTEEFLDILFYRRVGYYVAKASNKLGLIPNQLTVISIILGIASGAFFYFPDLTRNIIGIVLLVVANILDSSDGQLARMTGKTSKLGRMLDGVAGNLWFLSIYWGIGLRYMAQGHSAAWVIPFGLLTGYLHAFQAAMADYCRNVHLFIIRGATGGEIEDPDRMAAELRAIPWKGNLLRKIGRALFLWYALNQERVTRPLSSLIRAIRAKYPAGLPEELRERIRRDNKPLMPLTNILTFNTRAIALFVAVLWGRVLAYWIFELTVLSVVLIILLYRQKQIARRYLQEIQGQPVKAKPLTEHSPVRP